MSSEWLTPHARETGTALALPERRQESMRSLRAMLSGLESTPLNEWGHFRWHEGQVPAQYTCNRTKEPWLLGFAKKLRTQGVNFEALMAADDARAAAPRCGL